MAVIKAAEAPVFEIGGNLFRGLTSPSRGANELVTWQLEVSPNSTGATHSLDHEEVFIILEGQLSIMVDEVMHELTSGDAINIAAQSQMAVSNRTEKVARSIVCVPVGIKAVMADGTVVGTPPWAR